MNGNPIQYDSGHSLKKKIQVGHVSHIKNKNRFVILMGKHEIKGRFEMLRRRLKTVL